MVLYSTSMGIVRETYAKCANVKQILRTLLVKFEERDIFMSSEYQQEIKDRMQSPEIQVPQLYVDGQYIGVSDCPSISIVCCSTQFLLFALALINAEIISGHAVQTFHFLFPLENQTKRKQKQKQKKLTWKRN